MSRAFIKEDVDLPERSVRFRSNSGLPPGALNYMTSHGAERFRNELANLRTAGSNLDRIAELERILASATIIDVPKPQPQSIAFGAKVTVRKADGELETCRIVGVDEAEIEHGAVSWISPQGRALIGAQVGEQVSLGGEGNQPVEVVKIEY